MTKEKAIKRLKCWLSNGTDGMTSDRAGYIEGWFVNADVKAFEMAIKTLEQESCEDAISMQALAEAMKETFNKVAESLERTGQLIQTPEFQEGLKRVYALRKHEEEQMKKEDALEIGLAINAIATLLDDMNLAKVEKYLKRIEEITLKYVSEENKEE